MDLFISTTDACDNQSIDQWQSVATDAKRAYSGWGTPTAAFEECLRDVANMEGKQKIYGLKECTEVEFKSQLDNARLSVTRGSCILPSR